MAMQVQEVMTPSVVTIAADAPVAQAALVMKNDDIGWLPVVADGKIAGVLSDRDLVTRVLSEGLDPQQTKVSEIMSPSPLTCTDNDSVEDAAHRMEDKQVRRLLVVGADGNPTGMLSVGDLAARIPEHKLAGDVLCDVCHNNAS
jgi:CBS domain-containing protein